ncbi:MAG: hypothetical protein ACI4KG_00820 [Oscillospiraceae bacterium]
MFDFIIADPARLALARIFKGEQPLNRSSQRAKFLTRRRSAALKALCKVEFCSDKLQKKDAL